MPLGLDAIVPPPLPTLPTVRPIGRRANVAVTDWSAFIVSVHGPIPEQAPDQPVNVEPTADIAVSVTVAPWSNACAQLAPQSIPVGPDAMIPLPAPALVAVNVFGASVNT